MNQKEPTIIFFKKKKINNEIKILRKIYGAERYKAIVVTVTFGNVPLSPPPDREQIVSKANAH